MRHNNNIEHPNQPLDSRQEHPIQMHSRSGVCIQKVIPSGMKALDPETKDHVLAPNANDPEIFTIPL